MASSIETTSTTTTLKNNGNTYLSVDTNDDVAITNTLTATSPAFVTPDIGAATVTSLNGGQLAGNRNRIINGDMKIDQRNNGAAYTLTGDSQFNVDRFKGRTYGGSGRFSAQQVTDAPTGFSNSLKLTVTTTAAGGSYGTGLAQYIEGFNLSDLNYGTATAKTVTISFWVKSSIAGAYSLSWRTLNAVASCVSAYSISSADTWEYKTVTIPASTAYATNTVNATGAHFELGLSAQTSKTTSTLGAWQSGNYVWTNTQVDWQATSGATFYITGIQAEVGSVATPFEHRSYGTELALCQRYYEKSYTQGTALGTGTDTGSIHGIRGDGSSNGMATFKVTKRAAPSITIYSPTTGTAAKVRNLASGADENGSATSIGDTAFNAVPTTGTVGVIYRFHYAASAEL